jgi:hypothetical protein
MRTIVTKPERGGVFVILPLIALAALSGCGGTHNGQSASPDPARAVPEPDVRPTSDPVRPPVVLGAGGLLSAEKRHRRRGHVGFEYTAGPGGDSGAPEEEVRDQFSEISATAAWQILRSMGLAGKWSFAVDLVGKWGFTRREDLSLLDREQLDSVDFSPASFGAGMRWMVRPPRFFPRSMRAHITGLALHREREVNYQWHYFSDTAWGAEFAVGVGNWIRRDEPGKARLYAEWGYRFIEFDDFRGDGNGKTQLILPATGKPITLDESTWFLRFGLLF